MWYSSVMPQCSNQRTSERAQLLSAMTHPSTVLDLDAKQSFVTPKSYMYMYIYVYVYIYVYICICICIYNIQFLDKRIRNSLMLAGLAFAQFWS